ncbi:uncharacterized protein LOC102800905, partial [Saccoglossus kowalevskii]|uniref:Uncharacterized protein LOC102800905 n=1 Tax=Saccoglossus kowalevskii TaxID=10224 RepID=A0ABM0LZQ7_SACKO
TSLTCNTTLLSIIQDFIDQRKPGYYAHGMLSHDSSKPGGQYTPSKYTDPRNHKYNVDSLHTETPTNSHKNGQHYAEEYQSLLIRSEALKNEKDVIKESLKSCTQNISQQKKQIGNIAREEDKLLEQIAALQERLDSLRTHKKDYEQKMKNLIETQEEENSRLMLVEDTLRTIHNNLEKVKLLANNFNVQVGNQ